MTSYVVKTERMLKTVNILLFNLILGVGSFIAAIFITFILELEIFESISQAKYNFEFKNTLQSISIIRKNIFPKWA